MKKISIVSGCFNEKENLEPFYKRCVAQIDTSKYNYEFIIIDNGSTDGSEKVLRELAKTDKNLKVILNAGNFGHIRSPYHALMQASGDAIITMASDLEDPPELIVEFIKEWEEGAKIVVGIKNKSKENFLNWRIRNLYYKILDRLSDSDTNVLKNYTGFGLYDKCIIDECKKNEDMYPYFRGMLANMGYDVSQVFYTRPVRQAGVTKNNFYTLYDLAALGFTKYTKIPLRLAIFTGMFIGFGCLLTSLGYFIYKLIHWDSFKVGMAPVVIGIFFVSAIQLFFLGIIGEYINTINVQVHKRPLVIEKERINFS